MHSFKTSLIVAASTFAALAMACGGGDAVSGTWTQPNGTISIPAALGGGTLDDDVTLTFDDGVSPATFDLKMALSFQGLTDTLEARGTYTDTGSALTLHFTGFVIASGSGDTSNVAADGSQCVTLTALAGATVCFPTPQTDSYTLTSDTLTLAINNQIVGADPSPTTLTLARSK
jgi:hypothetical protein